MCAGDRAGAHSVRCRQTKGFCGANRNDVACSHGPVFVSVSIHINVMIVIIVIVINVTFVNPYSLVTFNI